MNDLGGDFYFISVKSPSQVWPLASLICVNSIRTSTNTSTAFAQTPGQKSVTNLKQWRLFLAKMTRTLADQLQWAILASGLLQISSAPFHIPACHFIHDQQVIGADGKKSVAYKVLLAEEEDAEEEEDDSDDDSLDEKSVLPPLKVTIGSVL